MNHERFGQDCPMCGRQEATIVREVCIKGGDPIWAGKAAVCQNVRCSGYINLNKVPQWIRI